MENLRRDNKRLKTACDDLSRDLKTTVTDLNDRERTLTLQMEELNRKKCARISARAAGSDIVELNVGGKILTATRSRLTQLPGTRLEAMFSGRWDDKLPRDGNGRIFFDMNPVGFRAILKYLNELALSSEEDQPSPPSVAREYEHILMHQLDFFGLLDTFPTAELVTFPMADVPDMDSNIIKTQEEVNFLHDWLEEDGSGGNFGLLYRYSQGQAHPIKNFHTKCNNMGSTLTIIETTDGFVVGGFSNKPWTCSDHGDNHYADKAFLFVLSGSDVLSPRKMRLKNPYARNAVYHHRLSGPVFGGGGFGGKSDLRVDGSRVKLSMNGRGSYRPSPSMKLNCQDAYFHIGKMEVFQVMGDTSPIPRKKAAHPLLPEDKKIKRFSEDVNQALNSKLESLAQLEAEILRTSEFFEDEREHISALSRNSTLDIVTLNVSGTIMATERSTLCFAENSVLAQQFDNSKWTEQGCNNLRVQEWTPSDVSAWTKTIEGIPEEVSMVFEQHEISGPELLALSISGLEMMGIRRAGTVCLLLKGIKGLQNVTLIEHCPYCFGKILDYLRLKNLHSKGLAEEPPLPVVRDSERSMFEKVAKYYFPGDSAKFILG